MTDIKNLIEREIPRLRRYARALVRDEVRADDLVQDCLERALSRTHLWRPGTDIRAWLFTIMHNLHVNSVRRLSRHPTLMPLPDGELPVSQPGNQASRLEMHDLARALDLLPDSQREVILLVALEGMRYDEVAEVLDVSIGTVKSRLSRGREALQQLMEGRPETRLRRVK